MVEADGSVCVTVEEEVEEVEQGTEEQCTQQMVEQCYNTYVTKWAVSMALLQSYHATLFQIQGRCAGEVRRRVCEEVPHRAEDQDLRPHAQNVQEAARQEV